MHEQIRRIDVAQADLQRVEAGPDCRSALTRLLKEYQSLKDSKVLIDSDIQYNWTWQASIAANREMFDRLQKRLSMAVRRAELNRKIRDFAPGAALSSLQREMADLDRQLVIHENFTGAPDFVRFEELHPNEWTMVMPLYTDILDTAFVKGLVSGIERVWTASAGVTKYRLRLDVTMVPPAQLYPAGAVPQKGAHLKLEDHVARFPPGGAILTTGSNLLKIVGRAIMLGPQDGSPHVVAHELGHLLGYPDAYYRGYRDLRDDGFAVTEYVDGLDLMGRPGDGPVLPRHFERLLCLRRVEDCMKAGLKALYTQPAPTIAVEKFQEVLLLHPGHYGATLQLAKALDAAGRKGEAVAHWQRSLQMALDAKDSKTERTARLRLAER